MQNPAIGAPVGCTGAGRVSQSTVIVSEGWGAVWGKWVCPHGWLRGSAVFPAVSIQSGYICGFACSSRRGQSRAIGWAWDVAIWGPSYRRLTFVQSPRGVLGRRGVPHPPSCLLTHLPLLTPRTLAPQPTSHTLLPHSLSFPSMKQGRHPTRAQLAAVTWSGSC